MAACPECGQWVEEPIEIDWDSLKEPWLSIAKMVMEDMRRSSEWEPIAFKLLRANRGVQCDH